MARLTEDAIDDFIYMARVNDVQDFAQTLAQHIYPARTVASKVVAQADTAAPADVPDDDTAAPPTAAADAKPYVSALDVLAAVVDDSRNTPLHMAAGNGHWDIVAFLLQLIRRTPPADPAAPPPTAEAYETRRKAFIDAANGHGNTALHWAALNGHLKVVQLLIEYGGASPLAVNDKDLMPLELAMLNNQERVIKYLMDKAEAGSAEAEAKEKAAADTAAGTAAVVTTTAATTATDSDAKLSSAAEGLTLTAETA